MADQTSNNDGEIPSEVKHYLDAVRKNDLDEFTECFALGALFVDVDRRMVGKDAIRSGARARSWRQR